MIPVAKHTPMLKKEQTANTFPKKPVLILYVYWKMLTPTAFCPIILNFLIK